MDVAVCLITQYIGNNGEEMTQTDYKRRYTVWLLFFLSKINAPVRDRADGMGQARVASDSGPVRAPQATGLGSFLRTVTRLEI